MRTKLLWTALFLLCFMVGRYLPIPLVHGTTGDGGALLNAADVATGGNFFSPSVFSLGLGPWMGAAILWRFLFIGRLARDRRIPEQTVNRARTAVMVVLAIVQAISLMSIYEIDPLPGPFAGRVNAQIVVVAVLAAGALLVAWLARKNEDLGLGGITMFILYQLLITAGRGIPGLPAAIAEAHAERVLWLVIPACVLVVLVGVIAGNAELRLHVNKVSIDNGFTGVSYLPIKLNPAGASPIMYALALLAIPQYVAHALAQLVPGTAAGVDGFLAVWGLGGPVGYPVYLVLLFALTIFFGLFTVDPREVAERMRNTGEYFDGVPPGRPTRRHIRGRVVALAAVSGIVLVILTGLPLAFLGSYPDLQYLLMAPATLMILLGLLWMLQEEIADTMIGTRYAFSLGARTGRAAA